MRLLVINAGDDLADAIRDVELDFYLKRNVTRTGFKAVFVSGNVSELPELKWDTPGWGIVIADRDITPSDIAMIVSRCPDALILSSVVSDYSNVVIKRPFLPGEIRGMLLSLCDLQSARLDYVYLLNSSPGAVILLDSDLRISSWNKAAAQMFGFAEKRGIAGHFPWEAVSLFADQKEIFTAVMRSGDSKFLKLTDLSSNLDKKYYKVTIACFHQERGIAVYIEDVTMTERKEQHLLQTQKMDSVGYLAAGLAHDFNNIIGGIEATLSSVKYSVDEEDTVESLRETVVDDFEIIEEAIAKGKNIIASLMSLSSNRNTTKSEHADLNEVVSSVVMLCRKSFPRSVSVSFEPYAENEACIYASPSQIEQMILNVMINASHAMTLMRKDDPEKGGIINLSISPIEVGENLRSLMPEAAEGKYWMLCISDTGVGISQDVKKKIFEPFFTTKEMGTGNGLGLSMVYNIVRQNHGFIDLFSEEGTGTTFMIFLPDASESKPKE